MRKFQLCTVMLQRKEKKKKTPWNNSNREIINQPNSSVIFKANMRPDYM